MLYDSDLNALLSQWQERLGFQTAEQPYKDALRDCIYDVRQLMNSKFQEEVLANEAFEQQIKHDAKYWDDYFNNLLDNGMFA